MTATNRSGDRPALDFARTPGWVTRAILPHLGEPSAVLDLGCGDGAIGVELRAAWGSSRLHMIGIEIDAARADVARSSGVYDATITRDALTTRVSECEDLVIANPPFSLAAEFYRVAVESVRRGGLIAFLLRATWMVPAARAGIPLPDLHLLRRRPSFRTSAKGSSTDSSEYAWHLWRAGDPMHGGHWSVLECEPPARGRRSPARAPHQEPTDAATVAGIADRDNENEEHEGA